MSKLALTFFTTAALCALGGMAWGMRMGMTHDFTMAPVHAHLNLVGWVTLALMGGFYALAGPRAPRRLGWLNYLLSAGGVAIMIPTLAIELTAPGKPNPGLIAGQVLTVAGMVSFLVSILWTWRASSDDAR